MERILTVSYVPGNNHHLPAIRIQGAWLQKHGKIHYKDRIRILVEPEKLTITKITDQPKQSTKRKEEILNEHIPPSNPTFTTHPQYSNGSGSGNHYLERNQGVVSEKGAKEI